MPLQKKSARLARGAIPGYLYTLTVREGAQFIYYWALGFQLIYDSFLTEKLFTYQLPPSVFRACDYTRDPCILDIFSLFLDSCTSQDPGQPRVAFEPAFGELYETLARAHTILLTQRDKNCVPQNLKESSTSY